MEIKLHFSMINYMEYIAEYRMSTSWISTLLVWCLCYFTNYFLIICSCLFSNGSMGPLLKSIWKPLQDRRFMHLLRWATLWNLKRWAIIWLNQLLPPCLRVKVPRWYANIIIDSSMQYWNYCCFVSVWRSSWCWWCHPWPGWIQFWWPSIAG